MKFTISRLLSCTSLVVLFATFNSCETTGSSSSSYSYYDSYDSGFYGDPWYYGSYYDGPDVIGLPPVNRPGYGGGYPSHPIARPPMGSMGPRPMPMPRGGGGRGRGR